jgi:hypothetical protein
MTLRVLLPLAVVVALAPACTVTRQLQARDAAVTHTCDAYTRCGAVGRGKEYADRPACERKFRGYYDDRWERKTCDAHIDQQALDLCLASIDATECGNVIDVLNTALNKCAERKVCGAGQQ